MLELGDGERIWVNGSPSERLEADVGFGDLHGLSKANKVVSSNAGVLFRLQDVCVYEHDRLDIGGMGSQQVACFVGGVDFTRPKAPPSVCRYAAGRLHIGFDLAGSVGLPKPLLIRVAPA